MPNPNKYVLELKILEKDISGEKNLMCCIAMEDIAAFYQIQTQHGDKTYNDKTAVVLKSGIVKLLDICYCDFRDQFENYNGKDVINVIGG